MKDLQKSELQNNTTALAVNAALPGDGAAPGEVQLIPAGPEVVGIDGRKWLNDRPQGVVDHFRQTLADYNRELPIDWEHASEHKAPHGDPAPAAAWCRELSVKADGSVWAKVTWTPKGQESVASREYRYLSPVILYNRQTGRIVGIKSVGLTNQPNLNLQALNREEPAQPAKETQMDIKLLLAALGLAETATQETALNAIGKLKSDLAVALNRAETPSLDRFVPRADYDVALNRATAAEAAVTQIKKTELETAINAEIESALKSGKITPATVDYHKANCRAEGGLELFKKYVATAPALAGASGLDDRQIPDSQGVALNAEQAKIATMFGNSAEDLKKYGAVTA